MKTGKRIRTSVEYGDVRRFLQKLTPSTPAAERLRKTVGINQAHARRALSALASHREARLVVARELDRDPVCDCGHVASLHAFRLSGKGCDDCDCKKAIEDLAPDDRP